MASYLNRLRPHWREHVGDGCDLEPGFGAPLVSFVGSESPAGPDRRHDETIVIEDVDELVEALLAA